MSEPTRLLPAPAAIMAAPGGDDGERQTLADDSRFLAASQAAVAFVERFGCLPRKRKAESVGLLTFLLLELLRAQYQTGD